MHYKQVENNPKVSYQHWATYQGQKIFRFRIQNNKGSFVELINYGATLAAIVVPDRLGNPGNVILGFDSFEGYLQDHCYIGSTVGRFANRISDASFKLNDETFKLEKNDGANTNHGGFSGFNTQIFDFNILDDEIHFMLNSKDGEGGYPGNLNFIVSYSFSNEDELRIQYSAQTDRKTVVNFTNHAYFNLSSESSGIMAHELQIESAHVLEADAAYLPTGKIIPAGTLTFKGQKIETCLAGADLKGLNTFYIFNPLNSCRKAAVLSHPATGRSLTIRTSYPGLMLYTGDYLTSTLPGYHGVPYQPFDGLCIECQDYPDSPNHANFPSAVLEPGMHYQQYIHLKFSTGNSCPES
ncbi:aldose 1-epimerase [Pedobacter cryoconitis]|uniref:Aldose 1-epimerase n=1 Tax=Pedobacter cryoconitis TaxID=188932 RepID=A0A7W8ZNG6_9SPHI|nr:aldose epimerase family protein [Pedobacter cryoconitis]MBB5637093.1 aldose 1-epimerase [Pedobacter cryoconitis]